MSNPDQAVATFASGLNCAQAVLATYAPGLGLERDTALKVASAFGAGMNRAETCGAVTLQNYPELRAYLALCLCAIGPTFDRLTSLSNVEGLAGALGARSERPALPSAIRVSCAVWGCHWPRPFAASAARDKRSRMSRRSGAK